MPIKELRTRAGETEKMTINLGVIDLGQIDLLVEEGFYSNRSDLIRTAIRNQIASHSEVLKQAVVRKSLTLGLQHFNQADLKAVRAKGQKLHLHVLGLVRFASDVTPELARETIASMHVLGTLQASQAVRDALKDRLK